MRFTFLGDLGTDGASTEPRIPTSTSAGWLKELWQTWDDRRFARSECKKALVCFDQVRHERPGFARLELYRDVVTRCLGAEREQAIRIVRCAEQSYAAWPAGREVCFRDIVTYVLVEERLISKRRTDDHADIEAIVAATIPSNL